MHALMYVGTYINACIDVCYTIHVNMFIQSSLYAIGVDATKNAHVSCMMTSHRFVIMQLTCAFLVAPTGPSSRAAKLQ